jgi:uncharacterized RDD family membrane protein YckC
MSQRYWGYAGPHGGAGPVSTDELALFLRERLITVDTPVCPVEGMQWAPLSQWLPELTPFAASSPAPAPLPTPKTAPALPAPSPWDAPFAAPAPSAFPEDATPFVLTPAPSAPVSGWTDRKPHPWRRYWARMLDGLLMGGLTWGLIGLIGGFVAPEPTRAFFKFLTTTPMGSLVDILLTLVVAMPGNALLLGMTGGTLGKWLFGIKIVRPDGRPIGVLVALWREIRVWFQGLAMGIPLVSLFTQFAGFSWLKDDGYAPWDKPRRRVALHRPGGAGQVFLALLGLILLFGVRVALTILDKAS